MLHATREAVRNTHVSGDVEAMLDRRERSKREAAMLREANSQVLASPVFMRVSLALDDVEGEAGE